MLASDSTTSPVAPADALPQTPVSGCSSWGAMLAMICLLMAWYLAISVPVIVYSNRLGVGKGVVRVVFAPIGWLHDRTPLRYPLRWTARMWDSSID